MDTFAKNVTITFIVRILNLILGIATFVLITRLLGPEGKGIYTLAVLLPTLIATFGNFGIGSATVYYVAKERYPYRDILGNNIIFAIGTGTLGMIGGLILAIFFRQIIFPGVAQGYLFLALVLVPGNLFFT